MPTLTERLLGPTHRSAPEIEGSMAGTVLLLIGPPISVVATLMLAGSVTAAFLVYHVGWCLIVPALFSLVQGRDPGEHRQALGLRHGRDREALGAGGVIGVLMFLGMVVPFLLFGDVLLAGADLAGQLTAWGVPSGAAPALFVYMLLFNSGAEELYWRGYVHERLTSWPDRWTAIFLATGFFASYHYYTIVSLVQDRALAALMTVGVFVGGLVWAILRERFDSVYPAILAHVGATAGYMTVYLVWI